MTLNPSNTPKAPPVFSAAHAREVIVQPEKQVVPVNSMPSKAPPPVPAHYALSVIGNEPELTPAERRAWLYEWTSMYNQVKRETGGPSF